MQPAIEFLCPDVEDAAEAKECTESVVIEEVAAAVPMNGEAGVAGLSIVKQKIHESASNQLI